MHCLDIGKFMNGYNMITYTPRPKGWDHADFLVCETKPFFPLFLSLTLYWSSTLYTTIQMRIDNC